MLACVAMLLSAAPAPTPKAAIQIEFQTEVDLPFARSSPLLPLPISARWVRGEGEGSDGPELFVWVSFGRIDGWKRHGQVFKGEWVPPDPAYPGELQIVVSTVANGRAVHSAMSALVSAEIELAGRSEPDAEVEILIGKEAFGPARAAHDGRFKVLVVVPPKTQSAIAKSKDRLGNVNKKTVDLFVPKVSTLALACPFAKVLAGATALPLQIATALETAGKVSVRAQQGKVSPLSPNGAFTYTPPERFSQPVDIVEVTSGRGEARCEIPLVAGPAVVVEAVLEPPFLFADGQSQGVLTLTPRDRFGNAAEADVALFEGGEQIALSTANTATLRSKVNVEQRPFVVKTGTFESKVTVYQIPDRVVRLSAVSGAVAVRVEPKTEAAAISASDDDGNDVALDTKDGELRVAATAKPKGHVLFSHVPSGQSVLVVVPKR